MTATWNQLRENEVPMLMIYRLEEYHLDSRMQKQTTYRIRQLTKRQKLFQLSTSLSLK
jgi:hypothetical protein